MRLILMFIPLLLAGCAHAPAQPSQTAAQENCPAFERAMDAVDATLKKTPEQ